ncbi:aliphatic sulfonate ABC transporter permease SsuC [Methylovirgula sp. 4M-Z18]|uniref:aliphatic sulfonate ABC transporter permease SsuC n=1 Tax=Methylovirgula sp. 4M-Z18 TaxID=2293567 RepID=UPI000E2F94DE|nr:aliphatic sulfonate ABC transporter permease SsuC [Methylovirgula sp. 4M-Z18]RFB80062.1 aliphatic sulfonate ABC transporter permease SsuC [Methylovirgula sp. 4M-Z18]
MAKVIAETSRALPSSHKWGKGGVRSATDEGRTRDSSLSLSFKAYFARLLPPLIRPFGTPSPRSTGRRDHRAAWLRLVIPVGLIIVWQAATSLGLLSPDILSSPANVLAAAWRLTVSGELPHHLAISALRAFAGLLVGGSIGFLLGLANGLSRLSEQLTDSTLQMVRNIPHLALIPLVILWFGIDETAKLFLVSLGVFFPIYINTLHGIRNVDPHLIEMGKSYGMNGRLLFTRILLPGALPSILVGLRYALGIMWLTLIVAETIAAQSGLGYLANQGREFMQVDVVVLTIVIYALLGKLADSTARGLEHVFLKWHPAFQTGGRR